METVGEEVVSNDVAGNAELLHGKACDLPPNTLMFPSVDQYMDSSRPESKYLSRCVISLAGSGPASQTSHSSLNDSKSAVKELTVGNYRTPNMVSGSSGGNERKRKCQQVHQFASASRYESSHGDYAIESKHKMSMRVGEQLIEMPIGVWSPKPFSIREVGGDTKETTAHLQARDENIILSNTRLNGGVSLKTSSATNFSLLSMKRALRGKGVVCRNREPLSEFGLGGLGHIDEKLGYERKVASDALAKSSASNDHLRLHGIDKPSTESLKCDISLRDWLLAGTRRRDKMETLQIFRQIVELVDLTHSQGVALQDLRPSCFKLLPSNRIIYTGSSTREESEAARFHDSAKKRSLEQDMGVYCSSVSKQRKISEDMISLRHQSRFTSSRGSRIRSLDANDLQATGHAEIQSQSSANIIRQQSVSLTVQLEEKWYRSPEQLNNDCNTFSSNIYCLGVLLFELLSFFESSEMHSAMMLDLHQRILPPNFLSENPKEAGFCLWLLHPDTLCRPTAREILQSELICRTHEFSSEINVATSSDKDDAESELLLHFLTLSEEQKQKQASKLVEAIESLEEDIKEVERRHLSSASKVFSQRIDIFPDADHLSFYTGVNSPAISKSCSVSNTNEMRGVTLPAISKSCSVSNTNEVRLMRNIKQIENAYISMRSQIPLTAAPRSDRDVLKNQQRLFANPNENKDSKMDQKSVDPLGAFFEGLCKFARYSKFEVCGSLENGDLLSSPNVICSLSLDRDEDYLAAAGVSKKIKVFEVDTLLNKSLDIHYPVVEMPNKSKLSCVCWNNYIKNYLASTDYDGVVKMWDAGTGQGFSQYKEHQKRAWSVDFSVADPMMFASGSDDCSVKLWSINESCSIGSIWNPAIVCCVQFSVSSARFLVFGSADCKIYCYDLRHTRIPWCTLAGHEKAVSYVKFLDSETLVSASTDNTLKLWDLKKTSSTGLSPGACSLTFCGHANEKNFVGLSALDGYIACGSETNEVYCYYRSLPMPITSHKFGHVNPMSGTEIGDDSGQFVSSVCWRRKSNMVVAANSSGNMKLLQMF